MKRFTLFLLIFQVHLMGLAQNNGVEEVQIEKEASEYEKANSEYLLIDAEKFVFLEDYERALAALEQALEVDKNNHAAYFKKAEILIIQEKLEPALEDIQNAITLDKSNIYYYVLAGQINRQLNELESAAKIYELMLSHTSGYEKYAIEIIEVYTQTERFNEALQLIDQAIVYYPNYPELYLKKAEIEQRQGKSKRSYSTITQAFTLFPEDPTILLIHIQNLQTNGESERVIEILEEANPNLYQAKLLLIDAYKKAGQSEEAKRVALSFFDIEDLPLESKLLALSQLVPNSPDQDFTLVDSLQQSLSSYYSDEPLVFENGGLIYSQMAITSSEEGKQLYREKAIDSYKKAAQLNPSNFNAWLKVFEFEIAQRQWELLGKDFEYLLDLYPNQAILYYYYAEAYRGLKDYQEAESLVDQGLRMASRNELLKSLLLSEKARIKVSMNDNDNADLLFNQAVNTAQIDERAIYFYADWLAEVNPEASKELMNAFQEAITKGTKWQIVELKIQFNSNQTSEAQSLAENMLREKPDQLDGSFYELYGDILFRLGSQEEALNQWRKALTLGGFSEKLETKIANKAYN